MDKNIKKTEKIILCLLVVLISSCWFLLLKKAGINVTFGALGIRSALIYTMPLLILTLLMNLITTFFVYTFIKQKYNKKIISQNSEVLSTLDYKISKFGYVYFPFEMINDEESYYSIVYRKNFPEDIDYENYMNSMSKDSKFINVKGAFYINSTKKSISVDNEFMQNYNENMEVLWKL